MKFTTVVSSLMLGSVATAQDVQSKPFNLVIQSSDKSVDGQQLNACHSGAAIESLCLSGNKGAVFHLNTTKGETEPIKGGGLPGSLTWYLPAQPQGESEAMTFYVDPSTNVALPLFEPGYGAQQVAFNNLGFMHIISYLNDKVTPPTGDKPYERYNWYVCETYFTGYTYKNLAWLLGSSNDQKPQNPSCTKVDVKRVFTK